MRGLPASYPEEIVRQIVKMVYGSHLFGTSVDSSDKDFKSVCLPSSSDILLQRVKRSGRIGNRREENKPGQEDIEFLSLQHYMRMLVEGQTTAVEMLFVPRERYVEGTLGPEWYAVASNKERFVHCNVGVFTNFALSQTRRYAVKAERLSAVEAVHGFFEAMISLYGAGTRVGEVKMDLMGLASEYPREIMGFPTIINPARAGRSAIEHFECCDRKVPMGATVKEASTIYHRVSDFYGKRARLAQSMDGQDWKALMHAVRIVREAEELLLEGEITFPRPEARVLLQIRRGELPHAKVMALIEEGLERVGDAKRVTDLPEQADRDYAEHLVESFYGSQVRARSSVG